MPLPQAAQGRYRQHGRHGVKDLDYDARALNSG
jgi:hypothetical protein